MEVRSLFAVSPRTTNWSVWLRNLFAPVEWDAGTPELRVTKQRTVTDRRKRLILRALRYILHSRLDPTRVTAHCKRVRLGRTQSERGQGQGYTTL